MCGHWRNFIRIKSAVNKPTEKEVREFVFVLRDGHNVREESCDEVRNNTRQNADDIAVGRVQVVRSKNVRHKSSQKREECRIDEQDQLCQEVYNPKRQLMG